jgi:hypothetical protein
MADLARAAALAELAAALPPPGQLLLWAEANRPPQEWYDEDEDDDFAICAEPVDRETVEWLLAVTEVSPRGKRMSADLARALLIFLALLSAGVALVTLQRWLGS